jgi:hypothetical protein
MSERRLRTRKRKASSGRAVRLSNALLDFLEPRRRGLRSYDAYFRRVFGLPDWKGDPQQLLEGCLEVTTGRFFPKTTGWDQAEEDAYEVAILEAAKKKTKKVNKPIRMREIA